MNWSIKLFTRDSELFEFNFWVYWFHWNLPTYEQVKRTTDDGSLRELTQWATPASYSNEKLNEQFQGLLAGQSMKTIHI